MFCVARTLSGTTVRLDQVIASLPDKPTTLIVDCPVRVDGICEIPDHVVLWFLGQGCLYKEPGTSATVHLFHAPRTPLCQVFGRPHEIETIPDVSFRRRPDLVYPDWWGGFAFNRIDWQKTHIPGKGFDARETSVGFQRALDALAGTGGEVHVAPGTYNLTQTIRIPTGIRLVGDHVNCARLFWYGCDGIRIEPGASNVVLRHLRLTWLPPLTRSALLHGDTGITMSSCEDVRIEDVSFTGDSLGSWFDVGIRQSCREADGSPARAKRLRFRNILVIAAKTLMPIESADDVLLEAVRCSYNIAKEGDENDRPNATGFVFGAEGQPPCTHVRMLDSMAERLKVQVHVVNVDGLRIEGCYFETWYRNTGPDFSPLERHQILVKAGTDLNRRALSGEGMDVGFNYFYQTFGTKNDPHVPSPWIEWANDFDRRMTKVFDLGGRYRPSGEKPMPPWDSTRQVFLQKGDTVYSSNPENEPVGWVCIFCEKYEGKGNYIYPRLFWAPFGPSWSEGNPAWRRYGWMKDLLPGNTP